MRTMKRRSFFGSVCEQIVYSVPDNVKNIIDYEPRPPRFKTEEDREKFLLAISRRKHAQSFNANFSPSSLYSTLTFDDDHELHNFEDAKRIRDNFFRVLKRAYPDAVIFFYLGRGKSTHRIHCHMVSEGVPKEFIEEKWKFGTVKRISNLRAHCYYDGVDHGQDYTGLANYLFNHWTPEQGGHRWKQTKNAKKPEREDLTEVNVRGGYSEKRPPRPPKGYMLVETKSTQYGYLYFKYVVVPPTDKRRSSPKLPDRLVS